MEYQIILTVYDELPAVLERRLRELRVLRAAGHVLARVAHRRNVLDHRQRHVAVGASLKKGYNNTDQISVESLFHPFCKV